MQNKRAEVFMNEIAALTKREKNKLIAFGMLFKMQMTLNLREPIHQTVSHALALLPKVERLLALRMLKETVCNRHEENYTPAQ